ncbi:MAG TPA: sigma-70 family RNA polymerase sigma factor [Bradyrhizobium sp.]|uniref:sigma-70 family RNA polymerase sigma factor n=1 Tax=Bradyrhizobium sp. TaxID=376 RepID=UPI002B7D4AB2|nr:sigma-70 family RNA polymerase sigma factor [Bradyrhizobium sp.]HLZ04932.1 sigma-70 family RNA polymerase sigma factor [Bradyrhizobium sp.]
MDSSPDLIERAQAGDEAAFRELVDAHRNELHLHCYRMLGSFHDAEDALQEALIAAWRGLSTFEGRSSIRTWLYRVATSRCLNMLRSGRARAREEGLMQPPELPRPTRLGEVLWIEPYPDALIDRVADRAPGPEALYQTTEAVSLAFITALQLLPPRQRAIHILRDVLGFHSTEVAQMVDATEESVNSALKRARATLRQRGPDSASQHAPPPQSPEERALVERFTRAFQAADIEALVELLTEDVWISMPPIPFEWQGHARARDVFGAVLQPGQQLVATRANGQPAFGFYQPDSRAPILHGVGLLVLTLAGDRISAMSRFESGLLSRFGLPRTLPRRPA